MLINTEDTHMRVSPDVFNYIIRDYDLYDQSFEKFKRTLRVYIYS